MIGLLIKDFNLMKTQKRFFIVVIAISIIMALSKNNTSFDSSFILGYITFVIPFFALSTISYDEFDNGNAFLFTLPISRKAYVYEKYSFSLLLGVISLVLAVCLSIVFALLNKVPISEILTASPFIFGMMVVMISIMIPIQLKFGTDKSRIVLLSISGIIAIFCFVVVQILQICNIDVFSLLKKLSSLSFTLLISIEAIIVTLILLLSILISVAMMNKKEF